MVLTMADRPTEFPLSSPPADGISSVNFPVDSSQFLIVSSWDSTVRLYDVISNNLRLTFRHQLPVLDCCFQDPSHAISGGLESKVKLHEFNTSTDETLGEHGAPVRCVHFSQEMNLAISGSWDATIRLWDLRSPQQMVGSHAQPDKVYTMDTSGDKLIVGTANRKVFIWDLRNMGYPQQRRESSLRYQTRCIRCFPNQNGFALSSIEGRVAIEYIDPSPEIQKKKYAFKCHRIKDGIEKIYPVNAISFHPRYNTFATGGSDGFVNIWDGFNKKRLCQFPRYPTTISSLAFSHDGSVLAAASSYMFEEGEKSEKQPDQIFIRNIADPEVKPK